MKKLTWYCPRCDALHYADDKLLSSNEGESIRLVLDASGYPETIDGLLFYIIDIDGVNQVVVLDQE